MNQIALRSPAKINLFLRILGRRADGFHDLGSLFQAISLDDDLFFQIADRDQLTCNWSHVPTDGSNLVLKAVELFRRKSGQRLNVKIELVKRIPVEAGLGGGSSNAATTLWAMNALTGSCFDRATLSSWAAELGSDVAFFFSRGTAYATGRGEVVRPLEIPRLASPLWIVKPEESLSTKLVYNALNLNDLDNRSPEELLAGYLRGEPQYHNDLEFPSFRLLPKLAQLKAQLKDAGCQHVLMSGSGTSFFCIGDQPPAIPGVALYPAQFMHCPDWVSWYNQ